MGSREFSRGRRVVARLPHGGDLLAEIAAVADAHGMETAELRAIGALQHARLAFYDQQAKEYHEFAVEEPVELVSVLGNVSHRDGATAVHAHASLAGHLGGTHRRARGARVHDLRLRARPAGAGRRGARARLRRADGPAAVARALRSARAHGGSERGGVGRGT